MPTYSIVIPVYNAGNYLEQCIDSVLSQSTEFLYEVILVDDGSADRSPQICDRYAASNRCVKVLHQTNQGVSAARNAGIGMASGEYILFLDGDDYWDACTLQSLDRMISRQPDIIEFGYRMFEESHIHPPVLPEVDAAGQTGTAYVKLHSDRNCMPIGSSCTAAFRRQLLETHGIRFPLGVSYGEDFDFHMHCLKFAETVYSLCQPLYRYRMNEASATHTPTVKKARDMLSECAKVYRLFPYGVFADYYCLNISYIANLARDEALQLTDLLRENRDILSQTSGKSARIACVLYKLLGWYYGSRLIRFAVSVRHAKKG